MPGPGVVPFASIGQSFGEAVLSGPLLIGLAAAAVAGLVSFASPCVLPLVPGYLSYVSGLSGDDLEGERRARVVTGAVLFVAGFTAVFVSYGALFGGIGAELVAHQEVITRVMGGLLVLLGLVFGGWFPGLSREWRLHRAPRIGVAGAPLVGALFAIGWTPCIGPTLAAVQLVALDQADAARGAGLSAAYALGLGLPFIVAAVAYRRSLRVFAAVRRHQRTIMRIGGAALVVLGVLMLTGAWSGLMASMQGWISGFTVVV